MAITDQQRREVAARLRDRKMTEGTSDPKRLRGIGRATVLESQLFWIQTCMLPAFGRAEVMGFEPMLDALADLIDRPTCRAVLCHGGSDVVDTRIDDSLNMVEALRRTGKA